MDFIYLDLARIHVSVCIFLCMYVLSFADSMLVCALADSYVWFVIQVSLVRTLVPAGSSQRDWLSSLRLY